MTSSNTPSMETSLKLLELACFFDLNKVYLPTYLPSSFQVKLPMSDKEGNAMESGQDIGKSQRTTRGCQTGD